VTTTPAQDIGSGAVDWDKGDSLAVGSINVIPAVTHVVKLAKEAGRALDDNKSEIQIQSVMDAAKTAERLRRGWTIEFSEDNRNRRFRSRGNGTSGYVYTVEVRVACQPTKIRTTLAMEFENIVATLDQKAQLPANRWRVSEVDGTPYVAKEISRIEVDANENIGYAPFEIPADDEWVKAFDHLYGLDDYIQIIKRTLELAEMSNWEDRVNIALIGPPACGKSDICKSLKKLLGNDAVLEFDGTSTTQAGAQKDLSEREELPRVLLVEEIEKAPESSLSWLLSVLDLRGEVRKTTARGNVLKEVHMIGICTVNSQETFDKVAYGALASRFSLPLHFTRPPREILWKILNREVSRIGGDDAWIEPALDFAEEIDTTDPRKIIAICLTGRDLLLTGEYQKMIRRTSGRRTVTTVEGQAVS
jgi:hypothetical protein